MLIRNCRQEDFFTLWEMDWTPLPKERDTIYLVLTVEHSELSFVAEDGLGTWMGLLLASRSADGKSCFLNHLLVMSPARCRGVGSAPGKSFPAEMYRHRRTTNLVLFRSKQPPFL